MTEKRFKADKYNFEIWDDDAFLLSFDQTVDLLNQLNEENEQLKSELEEVAEVCRKYGIYKEELQSVLADFDKMLNENGERAIRYKYCVNSR